MGNWLHFPAVHKPQEWNCYPPQQFSLYFSHLLESLILWDRADFKVPFLLLFCCFFPPFFPWTKGLPALSAVCAVVSDSSNFRMFQRCKHSWALRWALWQDSKRNTNSQLVWSGSMWSWFSAGVTWQCSTSFWAVYTWWESASLLRGSLYVCIFPRFWPSKGVTTSRRRWWLYMKNCK